MCHAIAIIVIRKRRTYIINLDETHNQKIFELISIVFTSSDKKTLKSTCIIMYIYTAFEFLYSIEYYNWIDNICYKKWQTILVILQRKIQRKLLECLLFYLKKKKKKKSDILIVLIY